MDKAAVLSLGVVGTPVPGSPPAPVAASPVPLQATALLSAAQKKAMLAPAIVSPTGEAKSLLFQFVTIPAGGKYPFNVKGNYAYVEGYSFNTDDPAGNNFPLILKTDTQQTPTPFVGGKREFIFPENYSLLEVDNSLNTSAVVLGIWLGFGRVRLDADRRDYRVRTTFVAGAGGAYAVDDAVGTNPMAFPLAISPFTQSAVIKKATLAKSTATLTDANFRLWLFGRKPTAIADSAAVSFPPAGIADIFDYIGVVSFPSFITGGAGSAWSVCDVDDVQLTITAPAIDADGNGNSTIYGVLTAGAAYVAGAAESFSIKLHLTT